MLVEQLNLNPGKNRFDWAKDLTEESLQILPTAILKSVLSSEA